MSAFFGVLFVVSLFICIGLSIYSVILKLRNKNLSSNIKKFFVSSTITFFVCIVGIILTTSNTNDVAKKTNTSTSTSSNSSSARVESSSSAEKDGTSNDLKTKQYDDKDALSNAKDFDDDSYKDSNNIGKSVHLTNAKIARVDKNDGGLWIQTISDDTNITNAHVQAINLSSYNFKEGDIVDIKATLQGMKKSMVTFKNDSDKYPTLWIASIEKTN
ncbi:hypothetical protein N2E09_04300 [Leuconostoc citreum]